MEEHEIAGIIIFILGLFGFTLNMFVVLFLRKATSLANSFGILTFNQAITDLLNSTIFAFVVSPIVFFVLPSPFWFTSRLGQLLFLSYDCCSWSHLLITLNRFSSLYYPHRYHRLFARNRTKVYVVSLWVVALVINLIEYVAVDCAFYLPIGHWNFDFLGGDSCRSIEWYLNYCRNMAITAFIAVMDIATLFKFHEVNKKSKLSSMDEAAKKTRQRQELYFLAQVATSLMGLFHCQCDTLRRCFSLFCSTLNWCVATTWVLCRCWVLIHALDGYEHRLVSFLLHCCRVVFCPVIYCKRVVDWIIEISSHTMTIYLKTLLIRDCSPCLHGLVQVDNPVV